MGQLSPLAPRIYQIQHCIRQFPFAPRAVSHSLVQWGYLFPLFICQVAGIRLSSFFFHVSILPLSFAFVNTASKIYHFGIMMSNVHMAWTRAVCGRIKSDYRYSKDVVYNNFPWPTPTDTQKTKIEQTAQAILDARARYPESSLADLYDELTMPPELRKAHQDNDRAVMQAYGFSVRDMTESICVAELMRMYQSLTEGING